MEVIARSMFDGLQGEISDASGVDNKEKSRTKQADADGADINKIMAGYLKTGFFPDLVASDPMYGDFSSVPDLAGAYEIVSKAEQQFASLGADVRSKFENDPLRFLEFVNDPKNVEEMVSLGLATKRVKEAAVAASAARDFVDPKSVDPTGKAGAVSAKPHSGSEGGQGA